MNVLDDTLRLQQLKAEMAEIEKRIQEKVKENQDKVKEQILIMAKEAGFAVSFPTEGVLRHYSTRRSLQYKHPETGATWVASGRTPKWLRDLESAGHNRAEFLI